MMIKHRNDYNKTGVLAASFQIGALIAGAKRRCRTLYTWKHIGIAFQIMDDYLDVFGDVEQFGKNTLEIFMKTKTVLYLLRWNMPMKQRKKELDFGILKTENVDKIYSERKFSEEIK